MAVNSASTGNFIGVGGSRANVISGNTGNGVSLTGFDTDQNFVENNLIGIDAAGLASLGNGQDGVLVSGQASSNLIGYAAAGDNNVISGNKTWGVYISDAGTNYNTVANNFIGTNVTGTSAVPNANNGVDIVFGAQYNIVGGTTAAARNLISGNLNEGVLIGFAGTANNVVEGNFIGTDATGKKFLANQQQLDGVYVGLGAGSNTIGGQNPVGAFNTAAWNVISGNTVNGILVTDSGTTGTVISGNFIGTDAHRPGRLAQRWQRHHDRRRDLRDHRRRRDVRHRERQRHLGQPGRRHLDHVVIGQQRLLRLPRRRPQQPELRAQPRQWRLHPRGVRQSREPGRDPQQRRLRHPDRHRVEPQRLVLRLHLQQHRGRHRPADQRQPPAGTGPVLGDRHQRADHDLRDDHRLALSNTALTIQFYASPAATTPAAIQGLTYIGSVTATTDASGNASFTTTLSKVIVPPGQIITATADFNVSSTSNFSNAATVVETASVSFVSTDTTTQGNWRNAYGADGYDIAADTSAGNPKLPSYATLGITGASPYTWAGSTTDVRALQNSANTGRIAATWYSSYLDELQLELQRRPVSRGLALRRGLGQQGSERGGSDHRPDDGQGPRHARQSATSRAARTSRGTSRATW